MVRLHGVDDSVGFFILPAQLCADLYMGALHIMVNGLADIMEKSGTLRNTDVYSALGCKKTCEMRYLD